MQKIEITQSIFFPTHIYSFILDKNTCDQVINIVEEEKNIWNKCLLNIKAKTSGWEGLRFPIVKELSEICCKKILPKIHSANDWKCEEAWINFYQKGDLADVHNHVTSSYSGVFIAKSRSNSLVFKNVGNIFSLGNHRTQHKDEKINEQDGLFILFPSWVYHQVEKCTDERITVAFNFSSESC